MVGKLLDPLSDIGLLDSSTESFIYPYRYRESMLESYNEKEVFKK